MCLKNTLNPSITINNQKMPALSYCVGAGGTSVGSSGAELEIGGSGRDTWDGSGAGTASISG